ncbi:MAG TPA: class I fructose-bisphosphate aldolase [Actinomycetota bacterium]|nr:class I fructose-bisphosphate aldolase [Actinomycetota bacterium]
MADLRSTAKALVAEGKGILAADESFPTIEKRFKSIQIENSEENRRGYRDMLFTTPGLGDYISGVILFDETIRQSASDGTPFADLLDKQGSIPGIKVDKGAKDLAFFSGEKVTEGLDGLRERCKEYVVLGARFTKWRAVITIGEGGGGSGRIPSDFCIHANAHALARYAALSQEAGMVPIVEPEVLMDGGHSIDDCLEATRRTLTELFDQLGRHNVEIPGTLLKTNMVVSGKENAQQADLQEVASKTIDVLKQTVPDDLPGVVFLSGGMSDEDATARLNEMNKIGGFPWELSFSYGRALQAPSLDAWKGEASNVEAGQKALFHRAKMNGLARSGSYKPEMENEAA